MAAHGRNRHVKRLPKSIAVINVDQCTGCEACREVCPVDCIHLVKTCTGVKGIHVWCEVDLERCIGCKLCVRLLRRKSNAYELKICPWDAIEMVPLEYCRRRWRTWVVLPTTWRHRSV